MPTVSQVRSDGAGRRRQLWSRYQLIACGFGVGMLLEMDKAALSQLLTDRTMLEGAVEKAQAALDS